MKRSQLLVITVLLTFTLPLPALAAQPTPAQELIQKAPANLLGLAATSGGDYLQADFNQSILSRLWHDPGLQAFIKPIAELLKSKIQEDMPKGEWEKFSKGMNAVRILLRQPIMVGGALASPENPYGFIVHDAGENKAEFEKLLNEFITPEISEHTADVTIAGHKFRSMKKDGEIYYWGWIGNHYIAGYNDPNGLAVQAFERKGGNDQFLRKINQLPGTDDILILNYDLGRIKNLIQAAVIKEEGTDCWEKAAKIIEILGADKLVDFTSRMGFAGPDIQAAANLNLAGPRTGLFAQLEPLDRSVMDWVDGRAINATAVNVNLAGVYDTILKALEAGLDQEDYQDLEEKLNNIEAETGGLKLREGLLQNLAGPVVTYDLPVGVVMGSPLGGMAIVAQLKNGKVFEENLAVIENLIAEQSEGNLKVGVQDPNGKRIHSLTFLPLGLMGISPCWSIVGDKFVLGSNLATYNVAAGQLKAEKMQANSLRKTANYQKVAQNLPAGTFMLNYTDTQPQFKALLGLAQQYWPMVTMAAAKQANVQLPAVLPNFAAVIGSMEPSISYVYADPAGLHSFSRGPLPGDPVVAIAGAGLGVSILLPALSRARQAAKTSMCMAELQGIGASLNHYANDHNNQFPDKLEKLIQLDNTTVHGCPENHQPGSYIYRGNDLKANTNRAADAILVHDQQGNHSGSRNVLFLDGHVQKVTEDEFEKLIDRDNELRSDLGLVEKPADEEDASEPEKDEVQSNNTTF